MHPLILLTLFPAQVAAADDAEGMRRWGEVYAETAEEYSFSLGGPDGAPLEFRPQSILNFSNPERARGQHGSVFVWTHDGRPEAIGTIWSIRNSSDRTKRRTSHEFQSLSLSPLHSERREIKGLGRRGPVPQWRPELPGIELQSFEQAADPAASKPARLVQMRRLARQFDAVGYSGVDDEVPLRLLDQPLLRYESPAAGVLDGGLFAMVMGTDPELLLLIEARETNGSAQWQFAAARFTGKPLELRRQGEVVWQREQAPAWVGNQTYFLCVGVEQLPDPPPAPESQ